MTFNKLTWLNGVTAVNAGNMQRLEDWIASVDQPAATTLNGTTAGTVKLYQPLTGIVKVALFVFSGYENTSATKQSIALSTPYITGCFAWIGGIHSSSGSGCEFLSSGTPQGFNYYTTPGVYNNTSNPVRYSIGEITTAWDTLRINASYSAPITGVILCIGI